MKEAERNTIQGRLDNIKLMLRESDVFVDHIRGEIHVIEQYIEEITE